MIAPLYCNIFEVELLRFWQHHIDQTLPSCCLEQISSTQPVPEQSRSCRPAGPEIAIISAATSAATSSVKWRYFEIFYIGQQFFGFIEELVYLRLFSTIRQPLSTVN